MNLGVRLQPFEGEAFGGFLQRLADRNGHTLHSLVSHVLHPGRGEFKQADIVRLDHFPKNILDIEAFEGFSGIDSSKIKQSSFWGLLNHFVEIDGISSTKIMRGMLRPNYAYCSYCIKEYQYRKLLWSVRAISNCPIHNLRLNEVCNHCMKSINLVHLRNCLVCPYCNNYLYSKREASNHASVSKYEIYVWRSLTRLQEATTITLSPQQVALKLIYILNEFSNKFDFRKLKSQVSNISLEGLLQQARGSSRRRVHLLHLLDALFLKEGEIDDLFSLEVPCSFVSQILSTKVKNVVWIEESSRIRRTVKQPSRKYKKNIHEQIEKLCEEMYQARSKITIREVSRRLGISDKSLSKWNVIEIIKKYKKKSIYREYNEMKINWELGIYQFLEEGEGDILTSEIYDYLGVRPSLIRKVAPEMIDWLQRIRSEVRASKREFNV